MITSVNLVISHFLKNEIWRDTYTVHNGRKDYKCNYRGKSFPNAHNLRYHIHYVHEDHKDHKCDYCGKSFTYAKGLKRHIHTIHEGHKDYFCEFCAKSFSHAHSIKIHIHTVHEGHKDHKCYSCGESYTEARILKKHIHAVHEIHVVNRFQKQENWRNVYTQLVTKIISVRDLVLNSFSQTEVKLIKKFIKKWQLVTFCFLNFFTLSHISHF